MYNLFGHLQTVAAMALFTYPKPKFTQTPQKRTPAAAAGRKAGKYMPSLAGARPPK